MELKRNPLLDTLTLENKEYMLTMPLFRPRRIYGVHRDSFHQIELYDDTKKYDAPYSIINLIYWGLCVETVTFIPNN